MKMLSLRTIEGPNVYHSRPVLIMKVDLQDWVDRPTKSFPIFNERLLESLDGLRQHHCSPGHAGGFVERLEGGTYLAHVIEHIALEMSELAGIGVDFGKSRFCGQQSQYEIVTRFLNEEGMRLCLVNAYTLADSLVHLRPFDLANALTQIRAQIEATQLGPTTEALLNAARSRGIPCRHFGSSRLEMGYGQNRRVVQAAVSDRTSLIAADLVQDKDLTKKFLQEHFVPVPEGLVVREKPEVEGVWERRAPSMAHC